MRTKMLRFISKTAWLRHLGSPHARLEVTLSIVPGRYRTPPEWDTRVRRLEEHLIYFFARESAQAEVGGAAFPCPRGSCCWIVPGTTFRFFSGKSPLIWRFRFSLKEGKRDCPLAPDRPYYFLPRTPAMAEIVHATLSELANRNQWQSAALRSWLIQLSVFFFRSSEPHKLRSLTAPQQEALSALLENTNPNAWVKPRDMAKATGLSLDYFSRVFHRTHGIPPRQWLVQERLSYAVVLLQETPLRVGEIAHRLGYANPHLFSRQFSAYFGRSPKSYRV